ncbi:MAG: diacylglycerol kinase [Deltaproteobacteria bacterium]|jgi:diacylglycerol kinase (ATP)|nr:diacylglycerol kinase [Deltaproteobacteria bacterium]
MSDSPLQRRLRSFRFAFRGIGQLFAREPNARIHALATLCVVGLGSFLGLPARDWAILIVTIALVLATEALNSALEALADRVAPDDHPLVARCKDLAAGAVLLAALGAVGVGLLVLGPPLLAALGLT